VVDCNECNKAKNNRLHGTYVRGCVRCCARLVISARPDKRQQLAILDFIERSKDAPSRAKILECVKEGSNSDR